MTNFLFLVAILAVDNDRATTLCIVFGFISVPVPLGARFFDSSAKSRFIRLNSTD